MTARKPNPTPKGHARWPLAKSPAQAAVLAAMEPGVAYRLTDVQRRVPWVAANNALHRLLARGLVRRTRKWWKRTRDQAPPALA